MAEEHGWQSLDRKDLLNKRVVKQAALSVYDRCVPAARTSPTSGAAASDARLMAYVGAEIVGVPPGAGDIVLDFQTFSTLRERRCTAAPDTLMLIAGRPDEPGAER